MFIEENAVEMNNVTATWDTRQQKKTLNGINLKIKQGELCAIIGPVGAGKVQLKLYNNIASNALKRDKLKHTSMIKALFQTD